jgi:hypothetical protein
MKAEKKRRHVPLIRRRNPYKGQCRLPVPGLLRLTGTHRSKGSRVPSGQSKERNAIVKRVLILAMLVGGLTIFGSTSTAGVFRARYAPYGYQEGYCPHYGYAGPVVATPSVVYLGPPVRVAPVYTYPPPVVYGPGYAYPGFYGR